MFVPAACSSTPGEARAVSPSGDPDASTTRPLGRPILDILADPESSAPSSSIDHRARHLRVTLQVVAHAVGMGETEDLRHLTGVDQIFRANVRGHGRRLRVLTDNTPVSTVLTHLIR